MKKRVTIYIEGELWDNVKDRAWRGNVSASEYISGLLRGDVPPKGKTLVEVFKDLESKPEVFKGAEDPILIQEDPPPVRSYSKAQQLGKS